MPWVSPKAASTMTNGFLKRRNGRLHLKPAVSVSAQCLFGIITGLEISVLLVRHDPNCCVVTSGGKGRRGKRENGKDQSKKQKIQWCLAVAPRVVTRQIASRDDRQVGLPRLPTVHLLEIYRSPGSSWDYTGGTSVFLLFFPFPLFLAATLREVSSCANYTRQNPRREIRHLCISRVESVSIFNTQAF